MNNTKKCHTCKKELDVSNFYKTGKRNGVQRYDTTCKECSNKIKNTADVNTKIICITCKQEKPASNYRKICIRYAKIYYNKSCDECNKKISDNSTNSDETMETKICKECKLEKSVLEFFKGCVRNGKRHYKSKCKLCLRKPLILEKNLEIKEKKCNKCEHIKPISSFYKKCINDGKQLYESHCIDCVKLNLKNNHNKIVQHKLKRKEEMGGCQMCGELNPLVLEFDHNQGIKNAGVSELQSIKRIDEEIALTILLCGNCHVIKTASEKQKKPEKELSQKPNIVKAREVYNANKARINELKKAGCSKCGSKNEKCLSIFEFDHIDRTKKFKCVSQMLSFYSWERIQKEIDGCILLCRNCHKIKTMENNDHGPVNKSSPSNGKEEIES